MNAERVDQKSSPLEILKSVVNLSTREINDADFGVVGWGVLYAIANYDNAVLSYVIDMQSRLQNVLTEADSARLRGIVDVARFGFTPELTEEEYGQLLPFEELRRRQDEHIKLQKSAEGYPMPPIYPKKEDVPESFWSLEDKGLLRLRNFGNENYMPEITPRGRQAVEIFNIHTQYKPTQ